MLGPRLPPLPYRHVPDQPAGRLYSRVGALAILVAFYSVLTGIAELHGAHWLWIAGLSKPVQLPVRILPLLLIATQLLVASITPSLAGGDPRMARIDSLMPLSSESCFISRPAR